MKPHLEILPLAQKWIWPKLGQFKNFVLYGGTALALRHGHRTSVDFDFFGSKGFDPHNLKQSLPLFADAEILQASANTLTTKVPTPHGEVNISVFGNLTFGRVGTPDIIPENNLRIAADLDIAVQKLKVIQTRAHEKDYLDLDMLFRTGTDLGVALKAAETLYKGFPSLWALKGLTYFKDLKNLPNDMKERLASIAQNYVEDGNLPKPAVCELDRN